ncbi:MAG: hypothetical protein M9962_05070 [Oligoflexia bacterium]|nr:hypothetical protein [Oligoflexia bacterium]
MGKFLSVFILGLFFYGEAVQARRAYFSATARASATATKVRTPLQASCMISLSNANPSGMGNQAYSVQFTRVQAIQENASTPQGPATDPTGKALTGTITPGTTTTWAYLYPIIMASATTPPAYNPQQRIICEGYIDIDDSSNSFPGMVVASGTLTVYQDTQAGVNNMGSTYNGDVSFVTYRQVPIIIGGGRPF